jgi:hypothetical protein
MRKVTFYIIREGDTNSFRYTFGYTRNILRLLETMQRGNPRKLNLIFDKIIPETDAKIASVHLEVKFKDNRCENPEWYELEDDDVQYIKRKANQ